MRKIKFRGKRVDNGDWVYGDLHHGFITDNGYISGREIHPETVGQFTGLKDNNGVEIYEGDIVAACWCDYEEPNHDTREVLFMTGIVEFTEGWMSYWIADYDKKEFSELNGQGYCCWTIEVIDNIYDNPELMEDEL